MFDNLNDKVSMADEANKVLLGTPAPWGRCPSSTAPATRRTAAASRAGSIDQAVSSYKAMTGSFNNNISSWPYQNQQRRNGIFQRDSRVNIASVTDGTSNTIIVGEVNWEINTGARLYGAIHPTRALASGNSNRLMAHAQWPINLPRTANGWQRAASLHSPHSGGAFVAMADGSVRFISESIDHSGATWGQARNDMSRLGVYQRLAGRNDGQVIGEF